MDNSWAGAGTYHNTVSKIQVPKYSGSVHTVIHGTGIYLCPHIEYLNSGKRTAITGIVASSPWRPAPLGRWPCAEPSSSVPTRMALLRVGTEGGRPMEENAGGKSSHACAQSRGQRACSKNTEVWEVHTCMRRGRCGSLMSSSEATLGSIVGPSNMKGPAGEVTSDVTCGQRGAHVWLGAHALIGRFRTHESPHRGGLQ